MSKALSLDLRSRVLSAIAAGLSCRKAAERFGVSASSAIRCHLPLPELAARAEWRRSEPNAKGRTAAGMPS